MFNKKIISISINKGLFELLEKKRNGIPRSLYVSDLIKKDMGNKFKGDKVDKT